MNDEFREENVNKHTFPGVVVLGFAETKGEACISNTIPPIITGSASKSFRRPPLTRFYIDEK